MDEPTTRIVVIDLRIPYFRLLMFFVKATLAAIPAMIIVGALAWVVSAVIVAQLGGDVSWMIERWRL